MQALHGSHVPSSQQAVQAAQPVQADQPVLQLHGTAQPDVDVAVGDRQLRREQGSGTGVCGSLPLAGGG